MTNLWVTFSTDISTNFIESSGNIIYNLINLYSFNGNLIDTTSNFIIYELKNIIQNGQTLKNYDWKRLSLNNNLSPFQGYWLGGINTKLPQIFTSTTQLGNAINNLTNNPISVVNIYGLIENWNVENINDMSRLFIDKINFNSNISNWSVGNVTNMNSMFNGATNFNQDLNNWNVGNVTKMLNMFNGATSFNGNISNWDVGNVTNMKSMFAGATSFNQDISNWDIGNVTDGNLNEMFGNVTFFTEMTDKIYPNGTPFNYFVYQQPITTLSLTSFYYGALTGSGYESELVSNDTTDITNILRISLSEKIQYPETLKNKYKDFSNYSGIFIKILDYIGEQQYISSYIYFYKITSYDITEASVISIDGDSFDVPVITSESIFLEYDYNTNNLGQRWMITDLFNLTHGNGGAIPGDKEFITDITYTGILEIDANNTPEIYTSSTNFVYLDTTVTVTQGDQPNVYNIILQWNGLTRTIEIVTIS